MSSIVALRPFVPARDYELSKRFYRALGFRATHEDEHVTILKLESFSFILQNFYVKELAENFMLQLMVRDVDAWWQNVNPERLTAEFDIKPPRPPAMQDWGLKVGFIFDPSPVLWHVADAPF